MRDVVAGRVRERDTEDGWTAYDGTLKVGAANIMADSSEIHVLALLALRQGRGQLTRTTGKLFNANGFQDDGGITGAAYAFDDVNKKWAPSVTYTNEVPVMTTDNAPSGVASASSYYNNAITHPFCAFDNVFRPQNGNGGTGWLSATGQSLPHWLQYQFASAKTIARYKLRPWFIDSGVNRCPTAWTLQGSNNGTDWTELDVRSGVTDWDWYGNVVDHTYDIASPGSYLYYRLNMTANNGDQYTGVEELLLYSSSGASSSVTSDVLSVDTSGPASRLDFTLLTGAEIDFNFTTIWATIDSGATWFNIPIGKEYEIKLAANDASAIKVYRGSVDIEVPFSTLQWKMMSYGNAPHIYGVCVSTE